MKIQEFSKQMARTKYCGPNGNYLIPFNFRAPLIFAQLKREK